MLRRKFRANATESFIKVALNERALQPQHPIAHALEHTVPARIRRAPPLVIRAIHFHDQPYRRSSEVRDDTPEWNLPAKAHAELATANSVPELLLRSRERRAHLPSAKVDDGVNLSAGA